MPRFYFHLIGGALTSDTVGTELPSLRAARVEAVRRLGALLTAQAESWTPAAAWSVFVTDAEQRRVAQFTCTENMSGGDSAAHGLKTGPSPADKTGGG